MRNRWGHWRTFSRSSILLLGCRGHLCIPKTLLILMDRVRR